MQICEQTVYLNYFCREWESPRIASSTATLNSSRDQDTMEIPQCRCNCNKIIQTLNVITGVVL